MASRGVFLLKFVGTVSVGLLTGVSYTISTVTVPTLLTLPSADTASRAFDALSVSACKHLRVLTSLSSTSFALAYLLSPPPVRHPYLNYSTVIVLCSHFVTAGWLAPYLASPRSSFPSRISTVTSRRQKRDKGSARMDQSFEVLGAPGSDVRSEGTASAGGEDIEGDEELNGEEVRTKIESFLKKSMVQAAVAGAGFLLSVVGIWGDGATSVYGTTYIAEA